MYLNDVVADDVITGNHETRRLFLKLGLCLENCLEFNYFLSMLQIQ